MSPTIRPALVADAASASDLVQRSFRALVAADWEPHAQARFIEEASAAALERAVREAAFAAVACKEQVIAGFVLMPKPTVLGMLFVDPRWLRRGIGRALWERARSHIAAAFSEISTVQVNATPYATPFYRALGFMPISAPYIHDGCRITRMACWLPARPLGAEPR